MAAVMTVNQRMMTRKRVDHLLNQMIAWIRRFVFWTTMKRREDGA